MVLIPDLSNGYQTYLFYEFIEVVAPAIISLSLSIALIPCLLRPSISRDA